MDNSVCPQLHSITDKHHTLKAHGTDHKKMKLYWQKDGQSETRRIGQDIQDTNKNNQSETRRKDLTHRTRDDREDWHSTAWHDTTNTAIYVGEREREKREREGERLTRALGSNKARRTFTLSSEIVTSPRTTPTTSLIFNEWERGKRAGVWQVEGWNMLCSRVMSSHDTHTQSKCIPCCCLQALSLGAAYNTNRHILI